MTFTTSLLTSFLLQPVADWPSFRGDAAQIGVRKEAAEGKLEELWKFRTKQSIDGAPAIVGGVVYVGSYDEHLYAIDLKTGMEKWKTKLGPIKSSPSVNGKRVYAGDVDGNLHCLDIETGKAIWKFEAQGEITGGANFSGDKIIFGAHDETLYCLDKDGKKLWDFKANGPVNGVPAVSGDKTFVAGCDNNLHVVEISTGKELGIVDLGGPCGATAALVGDHLYVGTMNNEVLAVDVKTLKVDWRFAAAKRQQPFYSSAAVTDKLVVVGSRDKKLYALDRKDGTEKWNFLTESRVDSSPVVVGDKVFIGSMDRAFHMLELAKGTEVLKFDVDGAISGSPAYSDGRIVVGTEKGTVYCFGVKPN